MRYTYPRGKVFLAGVLFASVGAAVLSPPWGLLVAGAAMLFNAYYPINATPRKESNAD